MTLLLVTGLAVACQLNNEQLLFKICKEDGIIEWSTVLFYFLAAYFFMFERKNRKNYWSLMLGLLCFIIAGEEASWGQRVFGYNTPSALSSINVQHEFNFHNLQGVNGIVRSVGLIIFSALCFIMPLTNRFSERCRRLYSTIELPIFPFHAAIVVAFAMLLMAVPRIIFGATVFNLDEIGELYLSLAMLLFSMGRIKT